MIAISRTSRKARKGFTLVEILIVVIILGILAAIVIPQFTNASTSARQANMASQDQTIKSQVTLYSLQHNDNPPNTAVQNNNSLGGLFQQITTSTDATGAATTTAPFFGPYLQATPINPLTNSSAVDYVSASPALGSSVGTTYGWVYVATTGEFHGLNQAGNVSDDGQ